MKLCFITIIVIVDIFVVQSFIVPDEIPTILSVIYSNIPVIKKGTDSRVGWGFRIGDRADVQVLVELGPQTYTQPLANQEDKNTNNKRDTLDNLSNTLYAQRYRQKQQKLKQKQKAENSVTNSDGGRWLQLWSKNVKQSGENLPESVEFSQPQEQEVPPGAKPGFAIGEIDAKSVIPDDDSMAKLVTLLRKELKRRKEQKSDIADNSDNSARKVNEEVITEESESGLESVTEKVSA